MTAQVSERIQHSAAANRKVNRENKILTKPFGVSAATFCRMLAGSLLMVSSVTFIQSASAAFTSQETDAVNQYLSAHQSYPNYIKQGIESATSFQQVHDYLLNNTYYNGTSTVPVDQISMAEPIKTETVPLITLTPAEPAKDGVVINDPTGNPVLITPVKNDPTGNPVLITPPKNDPTGNPVLITSAKNDPTGNPVLITPAKNDPTGNPVLITPAKNDPTGNPVLITPPKNDPTGNPVLITSAKNDPTGNPVLITPAKNDPTGNPVLITPAKNDPTGNPVLITPAKNDPTGNPVSVNTTEQQNPVIPKKQGITSQPGSSPYSQDIRVRSSYYDQQITALNAEAEQNHAEILSESHSRAAADAQVLQKSQDYTNSKFSALKSEVDDNKKEAAAGSASAMAQANIPQVQESQQFAVGAGVGGYDAQNALSVGASFHASRSTIVKMSVSDDTQSNFGYGAGVSVGW
ncbi:YadA-like family protein [Rahnella aceris]|jgi:autotransporter adhesin|uniref:YadA domain-containing protein n=5 Tax=Rahnella TaxID=34037 RepID=A0A0H3F9J6_RAHSY|nr:YadA-like family protein [Rahnella aceris]ADW73598.1 YadA domain-containing protein [Rahnella aceris]